MDGRFSRLLDAFRQVEGGPPDDLPTFLAARATGGEVPSPWDSWTLVGLVRHRDRQHWVLDLIRSRLNGSAARLARLGSLGHPDGVPQSGPVPGLPEWEYYFHGKGCCVSHKVRGDAIDVNFYDDTADHFDPYFYVWYLESLRQPEPPEARLLALHRSVRPVALALTALTEAGALVRDGDPDRPGPPRLAAEVLACSDAIGRFCDLWGDPGGRLWLAAAVGDWPAAHELAADRTDLAAITGPQAEACRRQRRDRLLAITGHPASEALHGLDDLGVADDHLADVFRGPPSGLTSVALEIAASRGDARWCPHAYELFRRVNPSAPPPQPHLWLASLKLLLKLGHRTDELVAELGNAGGTEIGEAVLLALEYAPRHAIPLVRKALLSPVPINRISVAAILALIGKPWSTRELLRALEASDDQETTAEARAALLELGDPELDKAVVAWERTNPHEDETGSYLEIDGRTLGPFFTLGELALKNCGSRIRYEMETLHDRVMRLKGVVPPEPPPDRPWRKVWGQ